MTNLPKRIRDDDYPGAAPTPATSLPMREQWRPWVGGTRAHVATIRSFAMGARSCAGRESGRGPGHAQMNAR